MNDPIVDLSSYEHKLYNTLVEKFSYGLWLFVSNLFFLTNLPYPSTFKVLILRAFGAKIGKNCILKPFVKIKFPWKLELGDNVWIGESVWLDNISKISIGNNVCISQNAILITGNHNYSLSNFELISKEIIIEDGSWICAKAIIAGGVTIKTHGVIGMSVMITKDTESFKIYSLNQNILIKNRRIS